MSKERSQRNRGRRMIFASNEHEKRESKRKYGGSKKERKAAERLQIMPEIDVPHLGIPDVNPNSELPESSQDNQTN